MDNGSMVSTTSTGSRACTNSPSLMAKWLVLRFFLVVVLGVVHPTSPTRMSSLYITALPLDPRRILGARKPSSSSAAVTSQGLFQEERQDQDRGSNDDDQESETGSLSRLRTRQTATLRQALGTVQHLMGLSSTAPDDDDTNKNPNKRNQNSQRPRGYNVEPRKSNIPGAGMGLFATQSIQAGTIVSYYPVHCMGVEFDDDDDDDDDDDNDEGQDHYPADASFSVTLNSMDDRFFSKTATTDSCHEQSSNYLHFLMGKRPLAPAISMENHDNIDTDFFQGGLLYIDVNPQQPLVPGWMSHLVNDGATVLFNTEQGVLDYYSASRSAKNCVHVPFGPAPILATVTTRKVKKGQELLTTYGCTYWLDALLKNDHHHQQQQQQQQNQPHDQDVLPCASGTDITDAIQEQATETARDILKCMQGVVIRRQNEVLDLYQKFNSTAAT